MLDFGGQQNLPTILLIDDDLVSREVIATVLTLSGYTLHTAEDGAAALEMLTAEICVPDAILMDAQMPGLSGILLIAALRARSKATVITISASPAPDEVVAAADGFLLKPFGAEALRTLLQEREQQTTPSIARGGSSNGSLSPGWESGVPGDRAPSLGWEAVRSTDEPIVSAQTLAQLREIMPEAAVRQIYAAIVADLATRLKTLDSALARGDATEVRRIGHAVKGGCGMAGALQAARLGALLEAVVLDAKSNHLNNSSILLRDLRAAAWNLERMLELELPA